MSYLKCDVEKWANGEKYPTAVNVLFWVSGTAEVAHRSSGLTASENPVR